jgi:hypothetical protein
VAQVLLRCDDERHWLRAAPRMAGHLFPRLLAQSQHHTRLRQIAPLMGAALRWLADATPATAELPRLMDATPVPCGTSAVTAKRSDLSGHAGYGYCPSHSRRYRGARLLITCTCDGTFTGFSLANPKLHGERDQARQTLERQPANRPASGTTVLTDEGLPDRAPWARIIQRLVALNACIWHNWQIGVPGKRSLIGYDHV